MDNKAVGFKIYVTQRIAEIEFLERIHGNKEEYAKKKFLLEELLKYIEPTPMGMK